MNECLQNYQNREKNNAEILQKNNKLAFMEQIVKIVNETIYLPLQDR